MLKLIAFDADDTLWHTEDMFQQTQSKLGDILQQYAPRDQVDAALGQTEKRNIKLFGYGIKGFTLSMVETAIELSENKIQADQIHEIVMMGKEMLDAPMRLFDGIENVLQQLHGKYQLAIITKGDLLDQTNKVDKSGLTGFFDYVEVVSEKDVPTYESLFVNWEIHPESVMMIGNSIPSDVQPVLELNGHGVHIPYEMTAVHEIHHVDPVHPKFVRLDHVEKVPDLVERLELRELI